MNNINVDSINKLESPYEIKKKYNINYEDILFINESRNIINDIINNKNNKNNKKLIIVGPCSIHDYHQCITYAKFIKKCKEEFSNIFIVIRLYFEKPRTIKGWKGFLYDPNLDNSNDISKGLIKTRMLLIEITKMKIPIATEFLDTIIPQYIDDLISWGCIGARTVESQLHRQLASGLSMAIGFKNRTDGNKEIAINAMLASQENHSFLGVDNNGQASIVNTLGNKNTCIVLRGDCVNGCNFDIDNLNLTKELLKKNALNEVVIVDVSHDNTLFENKKNYKKQINNIELILSMWTSDYHTICGIMIESNINEGKQSINDKPLKYGISITDGCINIEDTYNILSNINNKLNSNIL